jgi:hypothetical protein
MPTFKRARTLEAVVRAALADHEVAEAIIVVDGSPDDAMEVLRHLATEDHRVIPLAIPNSSQFRALAHGVAEASGEIVLLLDDDVHLRPGTAAGHAHHHAGQAGRVVLGYMPIPLVSPRRPQQFASYGYSRTYESQCRGFLADPTTVLRSLWGGNISIRREDFLRVAAAGLSSGFSGDDRDFGLRCASGGLTGVFDPGLSADHMHERTMKAYLAEASPLDVRSPETGHLSPERTSAVIREGPGRQRSQRWFVTTWPAGELDSVGGGAPDGGADPKGGRDLARQRQQRQWAIGGSASSQRARDFLRSGRV